MRAVGTRLALLGLVTSAAAGQAQEMADVRIKTTPVAGSISMLEGRGGNIGVCTGDDGVFLVDDQYAPLTARIRAAVAAIHAGALRFVLNTHWHGDHTGGNENLGKAGTLIVAHDNVRVRMSSEQFNQIFDRTTPPSPSTALPVVTFSDAITLHWNGEEIHAFHVAPAHTDGDAVVHFRKANVIHTGDIYFNGLYPFIDVDSGGSIQGVIAATERILALADASTRIIPGHGPLSNRGELQRYRDMLVAVRDAIAPAVAAGKSLQEVQGAKPTAAWDAVWGNGFLKPDQFVAIVHRDLSRR